MFGFLLLFFLRGQASPAGADVFTAKPLMHFHKDGFVSKPWNDLKEKIHSTLHFQDIWLLCASLFLGLPKRSKAPLERNAHSIETNGPFGTWWSNSSWTNKFRPTFYSFFQKLPESPIISPPESLRKPRSRNFKVVSVSPKGNLPSLERVTRALYSRIPAASTGLYSGCAPSSLVLRQVGSQWSKKREISEWQTCRLCAIILSYLIIIILIID